MEKILRGITYRIGFVVGMIGLTIMGLISRKRALRAFVAIGDDIKAKGEQK